MQHHVDSRRPIEVETAPGDDAVFIADGQLLGDLDHAFIGVGPVLGRVQARISPGVQVDIAGVGAHFRGNAVERAIVGGAGEHALGHVAATVKGHYIINRFQTPASRVHRVKDALEEELGAERRELVEGGGSSAGCERGIQHGIVVRRHGLVLNRDMRIGLHEGGDHFLIEFDARQVIVTPGGDRHRFVLRPREWHKQAQLSIEQAKL